MPLEAPCLVLFLIMPMVAANQNAPCPYYFQWQCHSNDGKCISVDYGLCNGVQNCDDNSDEKFCKNNVNYYGFAESSRHLQEKIYPGDVGFCSRNYFECLTEMKCVERDQLCDGRFDCADGSDENFWAHCGCVSGMKMDIDTLSCVDIDECDENRHECDQNCINTPGSYHCTCNTGYLMSSDGHGCIPDNGTLVISHSRKVQLLSLNGNDAINLDFAWQFDEAIGAIDYNHKNDTLYMAVENSIFQSQKHGRAFCLIENLPGVSDIAIDWVASNLYLAFENYAVQICRSDGYFCRKIVSGSPDDDDGKRIDQLVLNPKLGLMFWRGCYERNRFEICFIEMAAMNGDDGTIVADRLYDLSAMAIDYETNTLYFARYEHGIIIESIQIELESLSFKRKMVFKSKQGPAPSDMVFYDRTLFLATGNEISSLEFVAENQTKQEQLTQLMASTDQSRITMNHSLYQDPFIASPCNDMACQHFCVLKKSQRSYNKYILDPICICANGYEQDDGGQCFPNTKHNTTTEPLMCVEMANALCAADRLCANGTCKSNQHVCQCPPGKAGLYCEVDARVTEEHASKDDADPRNDDGMSVSSKILLCLFGVALLLMILAASIGSWKIMMRKKAANTTVVVLYKTNTDQSEPILCL